MLKPDFVSNSFLKVNAHSVVFYPFNWFNGKLRETILLLDAVVYTESEDGTARKRTEKYLKGNLVMYVIESDDDKSKSSAI